MENLVNKEKSTEAGFSPARLESFSDAVFAVAITLLVLSIHLPANKIPEAKLWGEIRALWPNFFAYVLSFLIIGAFWVGHHRLFAVIKRHDAKLVWLNMLFLMLIVFIPFPTSLLSEYGDTRTAVIFYAGSLAAASLVLSLIVWYAVSGNRLVAEDFDPRLGRHFLVHYLSMAGVFLASIGVAFINVDAAEYFWLLIWFNSVLIDRLGSKRDAA
jgi:uncharacterized membrane protein